MTFVKKILLVLAFILISAIIVILCINFAKGNQKSEYDGTLVRMEQSIPDYYS